MKKIASFACLLLFMTFGAYAQQNPVLWFASYKPISATEGEIVITGSIEKGWHTYSQRPNDAGPIPTAIKFTPAASYQLDGKTEESNAHEEYDQAFDAKIFVISDKAEFKQKIKLKGKPGFTVSMKVDFMCCNDKMCLPPKTVDLSVKVQ